MTIQLSYPPSFPSLPSRTLPPSLQISLANSCSIIELSITIIISCAPFAIGFWRRIYQNSALFSSIRSRNNLRKSNDRPPTTPPLSTIRTSRIGSAGSDFNLEVLPPRSRGGNRDSTSTYPVEQTNTITPGASQDHLAYHAI
jgi:hypothetical protein